MQKNRKSLHRFPKVAEERLKWAKFCIKQILDSEKAKVRPEHFKDSDYEIKNYTNSAQEIKKWKPSGATPVQKGKRNIIFLLLFKKTVCTAIIMRIAVPCNSCRIVIPLCYNISYFITIEL